jgi:hypothetical protein
VYSGKRVWKAIGDRLRRTHYLNRVDHVRKIGNRNQRMDIGKYFFVNRTIKNWKQLTAEMLGSILCTPNFLGRIREEIINGMKRNECNCGEYRLKVQ